MSSVSLSHPTGIIKGSIHLPASKSISNRALILQAVLDQKINIHNLSEADDTALMQQALKQQEGGINVKNAGTCMRFLTAYFAAKEGSEVLLLCDPRMELRPIRSLVDALKQAGADISYSGSEGFPPLKIKGKQLTGGIVRVDASASSQFISALMMIAPLCKNELTIELTGSISSQSYIDMTAQMMQQFGFEVDVRYPLISISNQIPARLIDQYTIEPDWSSASYWYEIAALAREAEIQLTGLSLQSLQGDKIVAEIMKNFEVRTEETKEGIVIRKAHKNEEHKKIRVVLLNTPDLAPALAVTAAATNTETSLTGLQNLVIKESNRLQAISTELKKCGFDTEDQPDALTIKQKITQFPIPNPQSPISTYADHRMAMAFAPLSLIFPNITIEDPHVVEKSYPRFWNDLQKAGFNLKS